MDVTRKGTNQVDRELQSAPNAITVFLRISQCIFQYFIDKEANKYFFFILKRKYILNNVTKFLYILKL